MEYKVIEIMNEKEIIINYGRMDGAEEKDIIRIYAKGKTVADPDTGEDLGTLDIIKADLEIYIAYEKFSVCRSVVRKKSNILNPISDVLFTSTSTEYKPIDVDTSAMTNNKTEKGGKILVGDFAEPLG